MNRIYQGKVTNVELANPDTKAPKEKKCLPFDPDPKIAREKWQKALWEHHELFQDAVNDYTPTLAAMAVGVADDSAQARALQQGWAEKVRETWASVRRKAVVFDGPQARLASILKLPLGESDFEAAAACVLRPSRATGCVAFRRADAMAY